MEINLVIVLPSNRFAVGENDSELEVTELRIVIKDSCLTVPENFPADSVIAPILVASLHEVISLNVLTSTVDDFKPFAVRRKGWNLRGDDEERRKHEHFDE